MKYNYLCKFYIKGEKCKHAEKCNFCHDLKLLEKTQCKYENCKFVNHIFKGIYYNKSPDKICPFWHKDEIRKSYGARMGIRFKSKDTQPFVNVPEHLQYIFDSFSQKLITLLD